MTHLELHLDTLLSSDKEDSISGRKFGQGYAEQEKILDKLKAGNSFKIVISDKIEFINDSFWKGFFNKVFEEYNTKEKVLELFSFTGGDPFVESAMENLDVLHAIYNH
jgi:hypothetical protein